MSQTATPADAVAQTGGMGAPIGITVFGSTDIHSPTVVNEYAALSIPAFYSGVRYLSETLAGIPRAIYQQSGKLCQPVRHPLNKLLARKTNTLTSPFTFFETFYHHAIIWGNGYGLVTRDPTTNAATGLYNLNPERVTPFRFTDGDQLSQWYWIANAGKDRKGMVVPSADMIHVPGLGFDGLQGYPIVWLLAETLDYARNIQRFGARYLKRGTHVQGSIEIPKAATKDQIDQLRDALRRYHSGTESEHSYLTLTDGASLKNNTVPPQQSQLIETMQASVLDLCRILRVSPIKVYDYGRATWGNAEQMAIEDVKTSLRGWILKTEEELSSKLLTEAEQDRGLFVFHDLDDLLRGDSEARSTMIIQKLNGGEITANEARAMDNLPPHDDPEADKLRIPVSFPVPGMQPEAPAPAPKASTPPSAPSRQKNSAEALDALLLDACNRVDAKTEKAFSAKAGKPQTIWGNVFAEEQAKYAREALQPVARALEAIDGRRLDLDRITSRYSAAIRRRAATGEATSLHEIIKQGDGDGQAN